MEHAWQRQNRVYKIVPDETPKHRWENNIKTDLEMCRI
jgi:hypothetical protein